MGNEEATFASAGWPLLFWYHMLTALRQSAPPQTTQLRNLVVFKNNAALAEEEALRAPNPLAAVPRYIDRLSEYIDRCWSDAKTAKQNVELQMLQNQRQRNGEYEPEKLAAIREMGGSEVYMLLTATKCRACEAHINDMLSPTGETPFSISPTPLPDLPPDLAEQIKSETMAVFQEVVNQIRQLGLAASMAEIAAEVRKYTETRRDEVLAEVREEAETRARRMMQKITDQVLEGGWYPAFGEVVSDMITFPAGILKGPVIRKRKKHRWQMSKINGKWEVVAADELTPEYVRVSPFDLYPAPDSTGPDDGYLIERHKLSRSELNAMIGVPGYNDEYIRKALADYRRGLHSPLAVDLVRAETEFSDATQAIYKSEKIEALEFWGSVPGELLLDWGYEGEVDPTAEYEINAWKVGQYVIRAIMNPDKLGRKPYGVDSFERIPGSFWGKGIPQLMSDVQDVCNAVARAIVNNAAMASGPQVEYDADRMEGETDELHPWKMWPSSNRQMQEGPAVRFYQPEIVVEQLLRVFEFFASQAEDSTGVPRWAYGNTNLGGAGSTSSGLSMLMNSASKGFKEFVAHIDRVTSGAIERLYDYDMMYDPDEGIKGDCRVFARGTSALLAKEAQLVRLRELLATTNNPTDLQIIGLDGRTSLLREALKQMDMPTKDILPDDMKLKQIIQKVEAQQAAMMQAQQQQMLAKAGGASPAGGSQPGSQVVPSPASQTLDVAGQPAGNPDGNLFQNQPGTAPGLVAA